MCVSLGTTATKIEEWIKSFQGPGERRLRDISVCVCVWVGPNGREKRKRADVFADIHTYWKGAPEFVFSQIRLWKTIFSLVVFSISPLYSWGLWFSLPSPLPSSGNIIERMALRERSRSSTDNTKKSDDNTKRTHVPALRLIFWTLFYHPLWYSFIWFSFVWFLSQPKGER